MRAKLGVTTHGSAIPRRTGSSNVGGGYRVRYGADGAPKNRGPRPFSPPRPTQRLGAGCLFRHSLPCPRSGPRPTHTPDGSPLKIGGNKRGPVQGMSAGGPLTGAGR